MRSLSAAPVLLNQLRGLNAVQRLDRHSRSISMLAVVGWLIVSNAKVFGRPIGDSLDYRIVSMAAPRLPAQEIGSAYSGRFITHYVIGVLADVSGSSLGLAYALGFIAVVGALLITLHLLLCALPLPAYVLCVDVLVPSPYFIRPYLQDPGSLQDLVFVLGTALCLVALLRHRPALVLAGLAIALVGRQSALLVAPVTAIWVIVDPDWRVNRHRRD